MPHVLNASAPGTGLLLVALASLQAAGAQNAAPPTQLPPPQAASAAQLPPLQPGLWEYRREVLLAARSQGAAIQRQEMQRPEQ